MGLQIVAFLKALLDIISPYIPQIIAFVVGEKTAEGRAKDAQIEKVEQAKRIEAFVDGLSPDELDGLRRTIERGYKMPDREKTDSTSNP
jgi:hypothetical protein